MTSTFPTPIIYLIRHGEKPPPDASGNDVNGLSTQGLDRAQGLRQVFGERSLYNIGYIIAEHPKHDGSRDRPLQTITPLAVDLGLTPNSTIDRDDVAAAAAAAKAYTGPGNVLLCWEHGQLAKIAEAMGVQGYASGVSSIGAGAGADEDHGGVKYPGNRFDLIWTVEAPYEVIASVTSEKVSGLDA